MEKDRCVESWPACWPTFNGWAGVIFLPLPDPLPVSGFPVKSPRTQSNGLAGAVEGSSPQTE